VVAAQSLTSRVSGRGSRGGVEEEEILRGLAARSNLANDGG
jgi:hypothetical protein